MADKPFVMIIEDEVEQRDLIELVLRQDFDIKLFGKGLDALSFFRENYEKVDMILLDIGVPDISATQIIDEMRIVTSNQPRMMVTTAYPEESDDVQSLKKKRDFYYLGKPFSIKQLPETINRYLSE